MKKAYSKAPLKNELLREVNRVIDYKKTHVLHNGVHFNAGRALLVEVRPNGMDLTPEHELARSNVVDELVRQFLYLPANGTFKHVYYNTTNAVEEPLPGPQQKIDVNDILLDESAGAGHAPEVNAMIGAILKLFQRSKVDFKDSNDIDHKLKQAFEHSKADAPDGPYNDLLCDQSMRIRYYYDKLKRMFVSGGFFLAICDCDDTNERKTMRIRASMLVTYEAPFLGGGGAGNQVPEKLDDVVADVKARAVANVQRSTKKYVTQRTLPVFQKYPHAGGRLILEALCVYSVPVYAIVPDAPINVSGRSMGVFDFVSPSDPQKIVQVITGQTCLQFLDVYACLHGIPEIKLESILRSFGKSSVQGNEFVFAPETRGQMPDFFEPGDWIYYKLTGTGGDWHSGVVDVHESTPHMKVRRWDPIACDFARDPDTVPVFFKDEQGRFIADIRPGQNVQYRIGETRRSGFKSGKVVNLAPGHGEWVVKEDNSTHHDHVSYNVRKMRGTSTNRISFLHEYYYQFGYDFEESETIYSLLTLRKIVTYHPESWYDPKNIEANRQLYIGLGDNTPVRQNIDPDHKEDRADRLRHRQHEQTPIYPLQVGSKLPVPRAYVHPNENLEPKEKVDAVKTRMESYLIPMVRKVTGVYKPRGEVVNKISLPDLDGKLQPDWRHLQSTVLQAVARDTSDQINRESWQFRFGILNNQAAITGPVPLGMTAGALYETSRRDGIVGLTAKKAERALAALAVGTARLQYETLAGQKRAIVQRSLKFMLRRKSFKRSLQELKAKKIAENAMPTVEPLPVLTPERANQLVRTSSAKSSELERAVSVTLPSRTSTNSSTTTSTPTQGHSMSYNQFVHVTSGAGREEDAAVAETPRRAILRSHNLPENLVQMLGDIQKMSTMKNINIEALADYDELRERAMMILMESDVDEALKQEIIQSFYLHHKETTAHVLLTPRQNTPVLVHTHQGELVALGNAVQPPPAEETAGADVPPSRRQARLTLFDPEKDGMTRIRDPIPALKGKLLEDVRSLCDSLYTVLADLQGESAGKGEKWFVNAANKFIKKAMEYFKVLNKRILYKLPPGTRTFAIQVFEDLEMIAAKIGTPRINSMVELRDIIDRLMNKISLMDEHVVFSFVDNIDDEEAWMYERQPNHASGRRPRVVHDDDEQTPLKTQRLTAEDEEQLAEEMFRDPLPAPPLAPVLPPILFPQLQQEEEVIEIDDDNTHFEYDSDIEFVHDTKNPHFGKNKHKHLQSVRRHTRLAR